MGEGEVIKDFHADDYLFVLSENNAENSANKFLKIRGYNMRFKVSKGLNQSFIFCFFLTIFSKRREYALPKFTNKVSK